MNLEFEYRRLENLGVENKIDFSIWFLQHNNSLNKPYHLAFSGGKDSVLLWWLCKEAKVNYQMFFYNNSLLNSDAKNFVLEFFPETKILKPQLNFFQLVEKKKILPTRKSRFCCQYFKECYGSLTHYTLTGVRNDESYNRSFTKISEFRPNPITRKMKHLINPLVFLTEKEVWQLIKKNNLPICNSYKTLKRNGCIGCPMSCNRTKEIFIKYPKFKNMWLKACKIVYDIKIKNNINQFDSPEDILLWYCSDLPINQYNLMKAQLSFDFLVNKIEADIC